MDRNSISYNRLEEEEDDDDEISSIDSNPRLMESPKLYSDSTKRVDLAKEANVKEMNKPPDLKFLASANFSSDSLPDSNNSVLNPFGPSGGPSTCLSPTTNGPNVNERRYSNSSLTNSPILQASASSHIRSNSNSGRARPKSAIFMMDSNHYPISEDGSPVQSASNTPRARNSIHLATTKNNYLPPPTIVPPVVPLSSSRSSSPTRSMSPTRSTRSYRSKSPVRRSSSPTKSYQPFNFQPQELMNNGPQTLQVKPAHRKGHKYKHSSVSMNLFQEPPPAVNTNNELLTIADLYPIPTFKESLASINSSQKSKLLWSFCHLALSLVVFLVGFKFKLPSLSTLAHLIFYDSLGTLVIVFVDIMSNFEVWNNSSIAYPFGLGRLEVLVGFALSASLIMVGCDLISHSLEEFVISMVVKDTSVEHDGEQHLSHHIHGEHGHLANWFVYELVLVITVIVTLITSRYILAYDRISEMISSSDEKATLVASNRKLKGGLLDREMKKIESEARPLSLENLQKFANIMAKNPTHFLTLTYSICLMTVPLLPSNITSQINIDIDEATTLVIALLLCYGGWRLVKILGGVLLLSYPYSDYDYHVLKASIIDKILSLDCYKNSYNIEKLFISKFNYELYVVGLKITMKGGNPDEESKLRFEINRIIQNSVEREDHSVRTNKIEVTIDINRY